MNNPMYTTSVPVFKQMLTGLKGVLAKADAHVTAKNIDPNALLQARLYPDQFHFTKQVYVATDFAINISSKLANVDVQKLEDTDKTFAELIARIERTLAILDQLPAANFEGSDKREIIHNPGTPRERKFIGQAFLLTHGLPHFFFHVTTAYDILRHNGVEVGKRDYLASA